jgi:cell wall-associated NlpC family hydrolase
VVDMQNRDPVGGTCDCSMFTRWAIAQAGVDIGSTTTQQWPANGLLPNTETAAATPLVVRGVGTDPPAGGYRPADLVFFGHGEGDAGHVALWLGNGLIVQCSSSGNGSNIRPLAGYVAPTGWVRWRLN